jgi:CheY-like chemotaxis protein
MAFSQKAPMSLREIDLNKSARSLEEMLVRTLGPSVQLLVVTNPEPLITRIDPTHVEQAIVHLAINASDAMPSGGFLTIQTEYIHIDDIAAVQMQRGLARGQRISGDVAVLRVSDSGAGMTAEVQARIFEPFFTTKGKGRSTGLGLSTVLGIVQSMGGAMTVHSVPGVGTSFAMYFPLVKPRRETPSDTAPTRPANILVLNEDAMELNVASRLLSKLGHKPVAAESSKDALRIIQDANVQLDCMVCSLHLGGTDARDFVSNVRKIRQAISVIYLSGFPAEHLVRCGRITASDVVVSRPYTLNSLRAALNAAAVKQTGSIAS